MARTKATPCVALAQWLSSKSLTQAQFARMVGVAPNTVYRWISGERRPDWTTMRRLADITAGEITPDSFLSQPARAA